MKLKLGLIRWHFGLPMAMGEGACTGLLGAYALMVRDPLSPRAIWPWLFIFLHTLILGRNLSPARASLGGGYLYARGFSRDTLWGHAMAAHLLGVLGAWAPAALIIWLPIRSSWQGAVLGNPYYPLFEPTETFVPLAWLMAYLLLIPPIHYAWIRRLQPTKEPQAGDYLACGTIAAGFIALFNVFAFQPLEWGLIVLVASVASLLLLAAGRRLHRSVEILK